MELPVARSTVVLDDPHFDPGGDPDRVGLASCRNSTYHLPLHVPMIFHPSRCEVQMFANRQSRTSPFVTWRPHPMAHYDNQRIEVWLERQLRSDGSLWIEP